MLRRTALSLAGLLVCSAFAQDRLPNMPNYDRYESALQSSYGSVVSGAVPIAWDASGNDFTFERNGQFYKYDIAHRMESAAKPTPVGFITEDGFRFGPERGRQFASVSSPDGKWKAVSRDRNVYISSANGANEVAVTTEGSIVSRIKFGTASWVYGEELSQIDAMWWSPDGKKLAYYRFDESKVPDYYLATHQLRFQDTLNVEAFPKPGQPNPVADLYVYDLATKKSVHVDSRFDSGGDKDLGQYVYNVSWSPDGKWLLYFRMNRRQNEQELVAADPNSGAGRVVFHRSNPNGWLEYKTTGEFPSTVPDLWWIRDGSTPTRFLFISDDSGYRNIDLYDLSRGLIRHVTHHAFDVRTIHLIDPKANEVWYSTQGAADPYLVQLHRIGLDGSNPVDLTDPTLSHLVSVSPTGAGFVDVAQNLTTPPFTCVCDREGRVLRTIQKSDISEFDRLGLKRDEPFVCKAADGRTDIYGYLMKPANFDPKKKYPLLISVYAGPDFGTDLETFGIPDPITELGFLVAWIDGRGCTARGRDFKEAVFHHLGGPEIDDQAAGAAYLAKRSYVDPRRIGIFGTSYGGYAALMAVLRYPEIFRAASASSAVTDWRNYDTIYTERYMGFPDSDAAAYDAASALPLAANLRGNVLLYFGTSDNNVHPSHTLMFVNELIKARKSYELAIGPDQGHSGVDEARMMEFFIDHLGQAK